MANHWPHGIADYLRWVRSVGGEALKGEGYIAWGHEGLKMWVLNNLLWNTDVDVDALIADYLTHCYGPAATPAMTRFHAQLEEIYNRRRQGLDFNLARWRPSDDQFQFARQADFDAMAAALAGSCRARATAGGSK